MRIVVAAGGVEQPAPRDEAALRHALLPDDGEAGIRHHLIRVGVEVAFHAVNPDALAHVAGDDPVVVTLLRQIPVMGIGGAVAQEHGTLDIALNRTLVRSQREKEFMEASDMLPCMGHKTKRAKCVMPV